MRARLKVSRAGVELIKSFEGLRTAAARLPDGRWTLGYGHTFSAREGATATQEDADALLRFDLLPIVDAINNVVLVPLNQNQFDALVSFCFNIGVDNFAQSSVCKRINEGRMTEAAQAMDSWRSAEFNGQTYVLAPLIRRRAAEKNLFLTPEDTAGNAPSLLIRPVEDSGETHSAPSEVDAPNHGGILSARPSGFAEPASPPVNPYAAPAPQPVVEAAPTSYTPSFEISATPQPVPAASVAPVTPERQVIDLSTFAPRPVEVTPEPAAPPMAPVAKPTIQIMADVAPAEAPKETVVEHLPHGLMSTGSVRETPAVEQTPTSYDYDAAPVMSPDVQAALARAQEDQRLREEAQRQAEALAAARAAEEARQREEMRLREEARVQALQQQEMARMEQLRLEQEQRDRLAREEMMRAELARLEQAQQEQARQEALRLEQERLEQARLEQARLEQARLDAERAEQERAQQARLEQARLEQARLEQEQAEQARLEQARLEQIRLDAERAEQARQEAARVEAARVEAARVEAARVEAARVEAARLEQERAERERQDAAQRAQMQAAAAAPAPSAEDAEKARKAEAAAALMRLYSPYGSGGLGRPLTPNVLPKADAGPALEPNPAPRMNAPAPTPAPQPAPVQPVVAPEPPKIVEAEPEPEADDAEVQVVSETVSFAFKPVGSASQMPPPQVTALNPYARPIPQATETFVEVPRPAAVNMSAPSMAPQAQAQAEAQNQGKTENLHWREQLQRPLPPGYQSSESPRPAAAPVQAAAQSTRFDDAFDTDDWTASGDRIALSAEEMEEETVSFWRMLSSTLGWIVVSSIGLACLGVGAGAFWLAKNNMSAIRDGRSDMLTLVSICSASVGILLVITSVWLIMKRLAGLKE